MSGLSSTLPIAVLAVPLLDSLIVKALTQIGILRVQQAKDAMWRALSSALDQATRSTSARRVLLNPIGAVELVFLLFGLICSSAKAGSSTSSSSQTPGIVRVVLDNDYAPYSFRTEDGQLRGTLVDQWRVWENKAGVKVELYAMDWDEAVRRMRAGEFDIIDTIVETAERSAYFDFTPVYANVEVPIFFRNNISGITDLASLKAFPVGVKIGDQHIEKLKAGGVTTLVPFQNFEAVARAAQQRKINVFVADGPSALYLLNKLGIESEFRQSTPIFRDGLQRAVRKGDKALLRTVMDGFAAINPAEFKKIDEKWYGHPINGFRHYLLYAGWAVAAAILLASGLAGWNHALRKTVHRQTAALAESEQRFRQIAEHIREVFWLTSIDSGNILYISPAYETIWGRTCESLYREPRSFVAPIHPEDRHLVIKTFERGGESGFDIEYRIIRSDGCIRWVRDRGFPIRNERGKVYRMAGIAEDITERKSAAEAAKQAEHRIRLVIDTIPIMAWSLQPNGAVDFVNQRWLDYTGLTLEQELEDPTAPIHPEDLARVIGKWAADMASGKPSQDQMRLRRADGEYHWFLVSTVPLRDEQGKIVKWFGTSTDIERHKEAEQQLRDSGEQLRALTARLESLREEERIQISREIHDELGQKLTGLKLDLRRAERMVEDLPISPSMNALLDVLVGATELVDGITASVQEIATDLRPGVLDKLGLGDALQYEGRRFQERTGIICAVILPGIDGKLSTKISTALFRIFQECLTNTARHACATKIDVTLKLEDDRVILRVQDNGRGITEAEVADPRSLGLLGMKERAALLGGQILFHRIREGGTAVIARLPRSEMPAQTEATV